MSPNLVLLQLRYAGAAGSVAGNTPVSNAQLPLSRQIAKVGLLPGLTLRLSTG